MCFGRNSLIFAGFANGDIVAVDPGTNNIIKIGGHEAAICKIYYINNFELLISFGYDNMMRLWTLDSNINGNFFVR